MCDLRRLRSACAFAQSDQSFRWSHYLPQPLSYLKRDNRELAILGECTGFACHTGLIVGFAVRSLINRAVEGRDTVHMLWVDFTENLITCCCSSEGNMGIPRLIWMAAWRPDQTRIYPNYWDTLTCHHTCPMIWASQLYHLLKCLKTTRRVANSIDPDQTPQNWSTLFPQACLLIKNTKTNDFRRDDSNEIFDSNGEFCKNQCLLKNFSGVLNSFISHRLIKYF